MAAPFLILFLFSIKSFSNPIEYLSRTLVLDKRMLAEDIKIGTPELAASYLKQIAGSEIGELLFQKRQSSLRGAHYHFQQSIDGIPIADASVVLSVDKSENPFQAYFHLLIEPTRLEGFQLKSSGSQWAFERAWEALKGFGQFLDKPIVSKIFRIHKGALKPYHVVDLATDGPRGYWKVFVSDINGKVDFIEDSALARKKWNQSISARLNHGNQMKKVPDFDSDLTSIDARDSKWDSAPRASGSGLVFDPDPITTLMDISLRDEFTEDKFEAAYSNVELKEVSFLDSKFHLVGPWVRLIDFESPRITPSTSANGVWQNKRKDVAFNDVMTYYHLDKNQRYIQSMGFTGEKGIQFRSIEVDANGLNGADNSHYIPMSNRIAFGHGCVDDNEDADVILHEYGHAINRSINPNFSGGDTGAMGEGFGDYWAGSYSLTTANGTFDSGKVFNWDGVSGCWDGRRLDRLDAVYVHSKRYGAHQQVGNFVSDELWSTPLFQSLLELVEQGVPPSEVDQIILEAQFGLGSGIKMRDMANSILAVALELQPEGPHHAVFNKNFKRHQIVE
jgi:hypothetical protein